MKTKTVRLTNKQLRKLIVEESRIQKRTPEHFQNLIRMIEPIAAKAAELGFSEQDFVDAASNAFYRV
jgi:hypothetical protein